jgi:hypothetical protein
MELDLMVIVIVEIVAPLKKVVRAVDVVVKEAAVVEAVVVKNKRRFSKDGV